MIVNKDFLSGEIFISQIKKIKRNPRSSAVPVKTEKLYSQLFNH